MKNELDKAWKAYVKKRKEGIKLETEGKNMVENAYWEWKRAVHKHRGADTVLDWNGEYKCILLVGEVFEEKERE